MVLRQLISGNAEAISFASHSHHGSVVAPSSTSLSVYVEHRDDLLNYANRLLGDRAIAEDVVQEAWLRLSSRDGKGQEIGHPLS